MAHTLENEVNREFVSKDGYDLCVSCKTKTEYKTSTPIDARKNYIEGAGQLCPSCGKNY